ncbi:MAG: outer membrane lipoprotein carrier protein LolA [Bacteroidales bacterium]
MKRFLIDVLLLSLPVLLAAQTDPAAIKALDKFSATAQSAPSVSIKFRLVTINQEENKKDTAAGFLVMSKDQYRLEMPDNITWFNGSVSWNYLKKEKEVTITKPGKKDDSFLSKPSSIFTLYKKGYKARLVEENQKTWTVDLYPEDLKNDLVRIRLTIGKTNTDLINAEYKRKDGISLFLIVGDYNLKIKTQPVDFSFDAKKYKDAEVVDMR